MYVYPVFIQREKRNREMLKENVCSFFENERAVNIFQNAEMYIWFFRTYEKEIKKERKQIFSRLKLLVKMQHTT